MAVKVKKLDKRHTGYNLFKYLIDFRGNEKSLNLAKYRSYCWNQFGPGVDVDTYRKWVAKLTPEEKILYSINEAWAWQDHEYVTRLYIKGDEELLIMNLAGMVS